MKKGARPRTIPKNKKEWEERLNKMEELNDKVYKNINDKKNKPIQIDWKGSFDHLEKEHFQMKEDDFNTQVMFLIILCTLLFYIDYAVFLS
jgi:hypothetical protein